MKVESGKKALKIELPVLLKYKQFILSYDLYTQCIELTLRSNPFYLWFGNDFAVIPVVRFRIAPTLGQSTATGLMLRLWDCVEPQISLKLSRSSHDGEEFTTEREFNISDIFDLIIIKNIDVKVTFLYYMDPYIARKFEELNQHDFDIILQTFSKRIGFATHIPFQA